MHKLIHSKYLTGRRFFPTRHPDERSEEGSHAILQPFGLQDEHSGRKCVETPRVLKCFFLMASLAIYLGTPIAALGKPEDGKLDIFVDGKRYNSMKDYKQYRLEKIKEEVLGEKSQSTLNKDNIKSEGSDQEKSQSELKSPSLSSTSQAAEIQELFNKLREKGIDIKPLIIDPAKIKTIQIIPKESRTQGTELPKLPADPLKSQSSNSGEESIQGREISIPK